MALTEIYVDAAVTGPGSGSISDPYKSVETAIITEIFDTTNGTRVNLQKDTAHVLTQKMETTLADTSISAAWLPGEFAKLFIEAYSLLAGDLRNTRTRAEVDCGGSNGFFQDGTVDRVHLINIVAHNSGTASLINLDSECYVIGCEAYDWGVNQYAIKIDGGELFWNYVHDPGSGSYGIRCGVQASTASYNWVNMGAGGAIAIYNLDSTTTRNIIIVAGSCAGIQDASNNFGVIEHNSIYSDGGTGSGVIGANLGQRSRINNNLIEGFSGAGGKGMNLNQSNYAVPIYGGNAVFDCTTSYVTPSLDISHELGDNEVLTASPFTDAANGDFSPTDIGSVKEGSLPNVWNN